MAMLTSQKMIILQKDGFVISNGNLTKVTKPPIIIYSYIPVVNIAYLLPSNVPSNVPSTNLQSLYTQRQKRTTRQRKSKL